MTDVLWVALLVLATWRISSLFVKEDGPGDILAKFRHLIGVYYDEFSVAQGRNIVAKAFTCVWCFSFWVGLGLAFFSPTTTNVLSYFVTALGLSAGAIIVEKNVSG